MIYSAEITTPKNTPISAEIMTDLEIDRGLIYHIEIDFPPGSAGLMGVRIFHQSTQLFPTTLNGYFRGNNTLLKYDERLLVDAEPFILNVHTYNISTRYDHTVILRVEMELSDENMSAVIPSLATKGLVDTISQTQDALSADRQQTAAAVLDFFSGKRK